MTPPSSSSLSQKAGLSELIRTKLEAYWTALEESGHPPTHLYDQIMREVERPLIELALARAQGNKRRAALFLGINRNTLYKKMHALDLENDTQS